MTVVSTATPIAPPSCRIALNMVEARPVAAGVIVANDAACTGTNTWATDSPSVSMSSRAHHRLVCGPSRASRPIEAAELQALAAQVLGAVVEYDAEHSGGLVASVRVWLEHDRQTDRAARALHIHPNTLLYRIRRFEQISGRSLASTESLAEVWLAMRTTAAVPEG